MQKRPDRKGRDGMFYGLQFTEINSKDLSDSPKDSSSLGYDDGSSLKEYGYELSMIERYQSSIIDHGILENRKLIVLKLVGDFDTFTIIHLCTNGVLDLSEARVKDLRIKVDYTDRINIIGSENVADLSIKYSIEEYLEHEFTRAKYNNSFKGRVRKKNNRKSGSSRSNTSISGDGVGSDDTILNLGVAYYVASAMSDDDSNDSYDYGFNDDDNYSDNSSDDNYDD